MGRSLALLTPLAAGAAAALGAAALCLYRRATRKRTIVITGGCGNLGSKLAAHLAATRGEQVSLVLIEHPSYLKPELVPRGAALVALDLGDAVCAAALADTLRGADALVHFSAVNPYPNATWDESAQSMDHCFRALLGAAAAGARRVVLASSNHVMGGYKDDASPGVARVTPALPPRCGTPIASAEVGGDAVAYAAAKLAAERLALTCAASLRSPTSFVTLRVGWCQPGANSPSTLSAAGSPPEFLSGGAAATAKVVDAAADAHAARDEAWFRGMWLSNGDFLRCFDAALFDVELPPGGVVTLNAMSNNTGARWCLDDTRRVLGVALRDDVTKAA